MNPLETKARVWTKIALYYALTWLFTSLVGLMDRRAPSNLTLTTAMMWSPALAAFVTRRLFGERMPASMWSWGDGRYAKWAIAIPFLYAVPVYLFAWLTGLGGFFDPATAKKIAADYGLTALAPGLAFAIYVVISLTAGFIPKTARALGEEIGWRGFLVPELSKVTGLLGVSLISGLMWSAWHFPAIIWSDYNAGTPSWFALTCFTVAVTAESFIFAWLTLRSRSIWPAAFLHGSHNMLIQLVLTPATANTGLTPFVIDEFGAGLAITSVLAAVIVWRKRRDVALTGPTSF